MIILPDRSISHSKFLIPIFKKQWKTPSVAQTKDCYGNENNTKFRIRARLNDGFVIWTGWFDDRDDFDAFLWAIAKGTLKQEKYLWSLCTPNWDPNISEYINYEFATFSFLTSPTGSNQTYTVPIDFNINDNIIETVGAGGSGGASRQGSTRYGAGGGGGAYSKTLNVNISSTTTYQIGTGGTAVSRSTAGNTSGNLGGDSWFGNTTLATSLCGAKGGSGGTAANSGTAAGGAGGVNTSGVGSTRNSGGTGGSQTTSGAVISCATGGGGAGGPAGNGNNGVSSAGVDSGTNGGSGGAGSGGTSGTGGLTGTAGGNGSDISSSPVYGSGGGGGGRRSADSSGGAAFTGYSGGNYGGGGGGITGDLTNSSITSGAGIQGLVVVQYTPLVSGFNMPMLGM